MQLLCIGDVAIADESLSPDDWLPPEGLSPDDDARILFNWELPIGERVNTRPRSSGPRLLAGPDSLQAIRGWSPGFATLATNHILDAGEEGLATTIELLNQTGFTTLGAGRSREEIAKPPLWETSEGRLAIVNWVFPETHPDWMAVPGPNCWPGLEGARRTIQELKLKADWVLVVVHWSDELFPYPRPDDRAVARELATVGADLVVGHHPHVVRGMETIGQCPVFYSIGNFYFSDIGDGNGGWIARAAPRNREGLGIRVSFRRGERPAYEVVSFWQTGRRVIGDPGRRAARRMERVSPLLQRLQGADYDAWYGSRHARFDWWDYRWHFGIWQLGPRGVALYPLRMITNRLRSSANKPAQ
jgi:hypothetical protein